jgi:hypothetical protein
VTLPTRYALKATPRLRTSVEQRELAGRLRKAGRDDLADALLTGETPPPEEPEPAPEPEAEHERLARQLNAAQSKWLTLGGSGGSDAA